VPRLRLIQRLLPLLLLLVFIAGLLAPAAGAASAQGAPSSATIKQALDLLLDHFVHPPPSSALLGAAWNGARAAAGADTPAPPLTGDRDADWQAFSAALAGLLQRPGVDSGAVTGAAIRAMAESVNESHTYYLSPDRYQEYQSWLRGDVRYSGIGARLDGSSLTVVEVFDESPAARAGLKPGDTVIAVDGQSVVGMPQERAVSLVRGPSGTPVTLTVTRDGVPRPLVLTMTRATVQIAFVHDELLPGGVGYLRLRGFPDMHVADTFEAALDDLQRQGATSLVLDLRGNSGGRLDVGTRLLSLFIQSGPLYHQVPRDGTPRTVLADGHYRTPALPLAVLVDSGTASMGEIFAAAIQDDHRGTLVGTTTAGSVAGAQVFGLQDGSGLQVTVMDITSAGGRVLNGVGVVPDQMVPRDPASLRSGHDPQLDAAVAALPQPALPTPTPSSAWLERLAA